MNSMEQINEIITKAKEVVVHPDYDFVKNTILSLKDVLSNDSFFHCVGYSSIPSIFRNEDFKDDVEELINIIISHEKAIAAFQAGAPKDGGDTVPKEPIAKKPTPKSKLKVNIHHRMNIDHGSEENPKIVQKKMALLTPEYLSKKSLFSNMVSAVLDFLTNVKHRASEDTILAYLEDIKFFDENISDHEKKISLRRTLAGLRASRPGTKPKLLLSPNRLYLINPEWVDQELNAATAARIERINKERSKKIQKVIVELLQETHNRSGLTIPEILSYLRGRRWIEESDSQRVTGVLLGSSRGADAIFKADMTPRGDTIFSLA